MQVGVDAKRMEDTLIHKNSDNRSKWEKLAVQQKMLTDTRKMIFIVINKNK